jgi:NadR type nicotinamide-nucleotide adenylyltransferase
MIKKIVAIGPESTGKSTLCKQLASHYKTLWVPEYAREYLENHGTNYSYENLLIIAQAQIALEAECESRLGNDTFAIDKKQNEKSSSHNSSEASLLFIDTDMYVMKVWCEFVFNKCPNWILDQIATRKYDMYLLCGINLPWIKDSLREYPNYDVRSKLYHYYKELMINQSVPWVEINGDYNQRLERSISAINSLK